MALREKNECPPSYSRLDDPKESSPSAPPQQQQPGMYFVTQPQVMGGPVQQVPYYAPPVQQAGIAVQQPDYPGPSDYLILALVTMIVCGLLNLTSLFMGIPAVIFAALSSHQRTVNNNYKAAKRNSDIALGLVIANIIYTLVLGVIITGVAVGLSRYGINGRPCYGYYYYSSYYC